jgi:hypothetical protein
LCDASFGISDVIKLKSAGRALLLDSHVMLHENAAVSSKVTDVGTE